MIIHTVFGDEMAGNGLIERLLRSPQAVRIALWLRLRYSNDRYFTAKEISEGIPALSTVRIKQILKKMHENGWVNRRSRENSGGPGPPPLEYRLNPPILQLFERGLERSE